MEYLILFDEGGRKYPVPLARKMVKVENLGVIDASKLEGREGRKIEIGGRNFLVLRPSLKDKIETLKRKAQIIGAKDSASMILNCNIKSGDFVVEGGVGSGALTIAIAHFVSPDGKVISYETRKEFASIASRNIEKAGLSHLSLIRISDITEGIDEKDVDAVILDIPNPWDAISHAYSALKPCGHFCSYSPTMEQVKETILRLRKYPFLEIRTVELLEREMELGKRGMRPSFHMLAHTGYLTFARKVLDKF